MRPAKIDKQHILELWEKLENTRLVAKQLGCSQGYVSRVKNEAGYAKQSNSPNRKAKENANAVLDELVKAGGTLAEVMERLGLKVCSAVIYAVAKERNINTRDYRHLNKSNGHWAVTKPGDFYRVSKDGEYSIPVTCMNCGGEERLLYRQLYKEKPPICPHCGCDGSWSGSAKLHACLKQSIE